MRSFIAFYGETLCKNPPFIVRFKETQAGNSRAIALNFLREGISIETVARGTGLSIEEVQQLQQQLNDVAQS